MKRIITKVIPQKESAHNRKKITYLLEISQENSELNGQV